MFLNPALAAARKSMTDEPDYSLFCAMKDFHKFVLNSKNRKVFVEKVKKYRVKIFVFSETPSQGFWTWKSFFLEISPGFCEISMIHLAIIWDNQYYLHL